MSVAYLALGMIFGLVAGALALANGSGFLLALVAYSATGALTILVPLCLHMLVVQPRDWAKDAKSQGTVSA